MKNFLSIFKHKFIYLAICRYGLGWMMIPYAISKMLRLQFVLHSPKTWQQSLEHLSGTTMAWSFLGYSPWFQVVIGILELVPAVLLLFRRTTLLGAVLMLPMTLTVVLVNYAYNLWDGTKLISSVLLLLNILVLVFEWNTLRTILRTLLYHGQQLRRNSLELAINCILITVAVTLTGIRLIDYMQQTNELTGDWRNKQPYMWKLDSEKIGDSLLTKKDQLLYFGPYGQYEEMNADSLDEEYSRYWLNPRAHLLYLYTASNSNEIGFRYQITRDSILTLKKIVVGNDTVGRTLIYKRQTRNYQGR